MARRTPRISEKAVQQQIIALLRAVGAAVYVLGTRRPGGDHQGTCQTPGLPDLYAFVPVVAEATVVPLWIECKAPGGKPRPEQLAFRARCQQASTPHVLGGLDAVYAWLLEKGVVKEAQVPHYRLPQESRV